MYEYLLQLSRGMAFLMCARQLEYGIPPPCLMYVRVLVKLSAWFPVLQYSNHCRSFVRGCIRRFRLNGGGLRHKSSDNTQHYHFPSSLR